jgi:hypothetical protein
MLQGNSQLDPSVFGMTAVEEHTYLGHAAWPGIAGPVLPPNASLKLFGGAAFERCLQEFQAAAGQLDVPRVARDKVANVLLAHRGVSSGSMCDQVAQQIACGMATAMLLPLLDAASKRLAQMLRRVFDIGKLAMDSRSGGPGDVLRMYVSFHASLQVRLSRCAALHRASCARGSAAPGSPLTLLMELRAAAECIQLVRGQAGGERPYSPAPAAGGEHELLHLAQPDGAPGAGGPHYQQAVQHAGARW